MADDALSRPTPIANALHQQTSYTYGDPCLPHSQTFKASKTLKVSPINRLTQVNGWGGQQASYTYDKLGRLHTTTLPNGVVTTHSYDDANRLTQIKHQNAQLLTSYTYTLNPVGNRTQVVEAQTLNGVPSTPTTIHYTYDPLHRLTQASYGGILPEYQYSYDALGNITQSTENSVTTAKTYNDANQLVSSTSGGQTTTYTYNGAGNLTHTQIVGVSHSDTYYSYNQRHLLTSHATSTFVGTQLQASFVYDGNGDRVQEKAYSNGQLASTTTYTNDPIGLTQVLVASRTGQTTHNLWGMDLLAQDDGQAQKLTLLTDALGSVRAQMRGTSLQATTSYGPYGSIHQQTGTSQTSYGYTGEQFHAGTGLLYLRARYYSPALHAFTARDPWAGDGMRPVTLNGYNYANANPVFYVDPTGEAAVPIVWCFGIAIAIPDPGMAEGACALFAVGAIGFTWVMVGPDAARQVVDDVIDMADYLAQECIDIVESAFNQPVPEPEYKVDFLPVPRIQEDENRKNKDIVLGVSEWISGFWVARTIELMPQGISVHYWGQWHQEGLSDVPASTLQGTFEIAFQQATQRARHIHFSLKGIANPIQYANQFGSSRLGAGYITAWELNYLRTDPHRHSPCHKTTFYENGIIPHPPYSPVWNSICRR